MHNSDCCDTTWQTTRESQNRECIFTEVKNTSPIVCPNIQLRRTLSLTHSVKFCKKINSVLKRGGFAFLRESHGGWNSPQDCFQEPPFESRQNIQQHKKRAPDWALFFYVAERDRCHECAEYFSCYSSKPYFAASCAFFHYIIFLICARSYRHIDIQFHILTHSKSLL